MLLDHKAFVLEWSAFSAELRPILERALGAGSPEELIFFVETNLDRCTDPYEGEPLDKTWYEGLEAGDVHEIGDYALTKYYCHSADGGLSKIWTSVDSKLPPTARPALLGNPIAVGGTSFDPGRQGSYFQSPELVFASIHALDSRTLHTLNEYEAEATAQYLELLNDALRSGHGLYITF